MNEATTDRAADKVADSSSAAALRRSTITDVARLANVSIKTVSRVVRCEPNVSGETLQKVRAAIEQLNYRPTISARSTTGARSYLIGLAFDNPNPSYSLALLRGAQTAAREHGYQLVFEPLEAAGAGPGNALSELVIQGNLEGVILPPPLCDDPEVLSALSQMNRPFARISPSREPAFGFAVTMDNFSAAKAMTEHLLSLGHRRIGFIKGRAGTATTVNRLEGYKAALVSAGIAFDPALVTEGDYQLRSGLQCGNVLLELQPRPTAIFASNDDMASGVLIAAHRLGLDVPADLSVAGFDDSEAAASLWPPLTTIRQPIAEMAAAAVTGIIKFQRNPDTGSLENIVLDYELMVRESTGPVPYNA